MGRVINVGDESFSGGDYTPIPAGTKVLATVYSIEEVPVKSGVNVGKSQLDITFKVQGGEFNGREIRYVKIPLYAGNAAWKLTAFAKAVGWTAEKGKGVELPDDFSTVLGTALTIKVSEEPPNARNQVFNSVSGYAPASAAEAAPAAASTTAAPSWGALNSGS